MQKTVSFKKKVIATAIASIATGFGSLAYAQDSATDAEEIVVTGIKASLQRAVDIKRDASGVVDAISSEDIGKLPDANLAESLQRITGISIDRTDGEGAKITARGFGPQFNLITLNGRQLSSASIGEGFGVDSSRSFDMSNIASESVSGVQVYKTGRADVPTGGIGATVNLSTARPFDNEGFKASIGGKALYDESNDIGDDITPEMSGFVSWSNETFGASLSATHQERNSGRSGFSGPGWGDKLTHYTDHSIFNGSFPGAYIVNEPAAGALASRTQEAHYFHTDTERKRDNALLTLQFKPTDTITTTLDYLYTQTKARSQEAIHSLWFSDDGFQTRGVQWDGNPTTSIPLYMWQAPNSGTRDIAMKNALRSNVNKLEDLGFNVAYEASDELSFDVDLHHSKSSSTPWNEPGSNITLGLGVQGIAAQGLDFSGDLPLLVGVYQDTGDNKMTVADVGSTVTQLVNARVWSDVKEAKVEGTYKFTDSGSINFGIDTLQTEVVQKQSDIGNQLMKGGWSVAAPGDVPAEWLEEINFKDYFGGYNTNLSAESKAFFAKAGRLGDQASSVVPLTGFRVTNFNAVAKKMFAEAPGAPAFAANPVDSTDRKISEDTTALFVQTSLDGNLGDMKVNVSGGIRYEYTDVESASRVADRLITWSADRDYDNKAIGGAAQAPYKTSTYHYNELLPNVDFTFHVTDELIARASASKTISRAGYDQLQQGSTGNPNKGGPIIVGGGSIGDNSDGNVKLKPIESNNLDLSVEYYFNNTDYVSVGYFNKRVPNFIGTQEQKVTYAGSLNPSEGPRAQAAVAELKKRGLELTQQNLFQMVASMNDTAHGCVNAPGKDLCGKPFDSADYNTWRSSVDIVPVAGDPAIVNNTMMPVNSKDAELHGWEFAAQHFFGDTGFGVQANYTVVRGSIGFNLNAEPNTGQFALTGLSDTANLIGIYEKDQWQARVAYNWRDKFLDNANVGGGEPEFTRAFGQVDFNVGYKFTEDLTVSLEGTNVLGKDKRTYGRTTAEIKYLDILEPRYALSARYNF